MTEVQFEVGQHVEPGEVVALASSIYGDVPDLGHESYYQWLYRDNPAGTAVVAAARISGVLVGHYAVVPSVVWLNGQEILAGQGVNAMTRRDHEGRGIFARLVSLADEACRDCGIRLVYAIPGPQAAPWFRTLLRYGEAAPIPLWLRPVRLGGLLRPGADRPEMVRRLVRGLDAGLVPLLRQWRARRNSHGLEIRPMDRAGPEVDALWGRGRGSYQFVLARSSRHLSWRYLCCPSRQYRIWGAYAGQELCAYLIARERIVQRWPWMRMGSLVDLFAEPGARGVNALRLLVAEAVAGLCEDGVGAIMVQGVSPQLRPALCGNGFFQIPRRTQTWVPLMVRWLDRPNGGAKSPGRVHFTAGDHDMG